MTSKFEIDTYQKLELAASFFLEESFSYLDSALTYEFSCILFSQELNKIEPTNEDMEIIKKAGIPNDPVVLLQSDIPDVLSERTNELFLKSWNVSQIRAQKEKHKFRLNHRINAIEMLGHINNFGFFIETLVNRHLLFLHHTKIIDDFSYSRLANSKIFERLIYIFKDELNNKTLHLNEISNLFSLRNKTVHFTPVNAKSLKPRISELIQIWTQSIEMLNKLEEKENFNENRFSLRLEVYKNLFKSHWT